jgi:hypothetical protein
MDLIPASLEGHMYLLTRIDRSTRWVEAMPASHAVAADSPTLARAEHVSVRVGSQQKPLAALYGGHTRWWPRGRRSFLWYT